MKFCFHILLIFFIPFLSSCAGDDENLQYETDGYKMVLVGHSFFRPYAEKFNEIALDAGFDNHDGVVVSHGGETGSPVNLWSDSTLSQHRLIKEELNKGGVDVLGMSADILLENPTDGYKDWITGQATLTLYELQRDSLLLDDILYRGNREYSLFTDELGHQGDIIINTGALMWLESIYNINLDENDYETGFNTDLHSIAQDILDSYNQN